MLKTVTNIIDASQIKTPITFVGDVTLSTGNLVIGTSGKGIDFSATSSGSGTMTSELLSDYEEGTFTATLTATTPPTTPPTTTARYTRIGRQVTVSIAFDLANTTGGVGNMKITGLPFTPASVAISNYLSFDMNIGGYPVAVIFSGATEIYFYFTTTGAGWTNQAITAGASKYMYLSLTYTV